MQLQELKAKLFEFQKNNDTLRVSVLRYLLAQVHNREIELRAESKEIDNEGLVNIIEKQIKQRDDSIESFREGNRQDLVDKETGERVVLKEFLEMVKLT